jgi:hypothetical protein
LPSKAAHFNELAQGQPVTTVQPRCIPVATGSTKTSTSSDQTECTAMQPEGPAMPKNKPGDGLPGVCGEVSGAGDNLGREAQNLSLSVKRAAPDLAALIAVWPRLEDWQRRAIGQIAEGQPCRP